MKLLIIDDEKTVRNILLQWAEEWNYEVVALPNAEEAWQYLQEEQESVIALVDWVMPGMDGLSLCKLIKRSEWASRVYVIILTVKSTVEDMIGGFDAGADDFIRKPVHPQELCSRLAVGTRTLQYQRELEQRNAALQSTTAVLENILQKLHEANQQLQDLSLHDGMTGLANRRSLEEHMGREWGYAMRQQQPLSFIMVDVDEFKAFNDTYGHQAGDECLVRVAHTLADIVRRRSDLVSRYGGEEFAVILRNTDFLGARVVAEHMRCAVEKLRIPHEAASGAEFVTISLGVASRIPQRGESYDVLIQEADQALYAAKNSGRNRWMSDGGECPVTEM